MIAQVSELKYVGDGTLTTGNHTFNNLALLETVNSPTMTTHTRQFSFYQISPYFQLVAMFTFNDSTKNVIMNVYPPAGTIGAPAAPSNLTTTPVNSIRLDWQDNSNNEDGFIIETTQDTLSGSWTIVDTVATDVITYIHTGLTNGVTYYYRVKAYNANGNSAWSNISGATEGTAGISKMYNNELMFDIYPNPAKEMAIIENLASGSTLTITDIAGKVVYSTFINKEQVIINTSEFENGVYIVQIANNHAVYNKKLVVNN
ncbi:MAG: T9SS type A sorting domain-containing protein [Bacteroidia bacterium]|nr:T9SS type A sorting domain-containing protein [Bacteroidia bacterium]MCZ2247858.1 T9SS type A sorting domain-containing protein [Bacteroidia bacterium]